MILRQLFVFKIQIICALMFILNLKSKNLAIYCIKRHFKKSLCLDLVKNSFLSNRLNYLIMLLLKLRKYKNFETSWQ